MSHKLLKKLITIILLAPLHTQDIICTNTIEKIAKPLNKPITGIEVVLSCKTVSRCRVVILAKESTVYNFWYTKLVLND